MKQALAFLLEDYAAAVLFLIARAVSGSWRAAVAAVVLAALLPVARRILSRRRVEPLRWLNLALVLALGVAAWLGQNPRFIMAKPTAVHLAVAAAMARAGWMMRYLNGTAQQNVPRAVVIAAGHAWAVLLAALGFTNLIIALYFDLATWAWFVTTILPGVKLAALALQYAVFRRIIRRRLSQAAALGAGCGK
jgi:intracellular septation protein